MKQSKILLSWSGGRDSSIALYEILQNSDYQVSALLTTLTEGYDRISMHGVRRELLELQAQSLGFELCKVYIPKDSSDEEYESRMKKSLASYQAEGVEAVAFGDIFLSDIRERREQKLSQIGMKALFPIWNQNTSELANKFIDLGFKAVVTCVDPKFLDESFAGRVIDKKFLSDLPKNVDPCGENGEFHSFVHDGPIFKKPIEISVGETVLRSGFHFCDLVSG